MGEKSGKAKEAGGAGGGISEKESVLVAPRESAEGLRAEIGMLVRGYSWKVCRGH